MLFRSGFYSSDPYDVKYFVIDNPYDDAVCVMTLSLSLSCCWGQIGDMSLADNATLCLSAIVTQLAALGAAEEQYKEIVQYTILDAVRKGLRSKVEVRTHTHTHTHTLESSITI